MWSKEPGIAKVLFTTYIDDLEIPIYLCGTRSQA